MPVIFEKLYDKYFVNLEIVLNSLKYNWYDTQYINMFILLYVRYY